MISVIICGVCGKMGHALLEACSQDDEIMAVGGVERAGHPSLGMPIGYGHKVTDDLEKCLAQEDPNQIVDVILDFTTSESATDHLQAARLHRKPMVIGTTGFTAKQMSRIGEYAKVVPVVLAPNFSIGVNIMFKVLADVARITGDAYDVEIVEAHHNQKKDAPSGTAVKLAQVIAKALSRDLEQVGVYSRKGQIGQRDKMEIGIQAIRGGDIFGEHTVMFCGQGERLEFIHRASSRDNFARGAIMAAKWVVGKPKGLYDMQDVLGLK